MAHSKSEIRKAKNLLNKYAPKGEQLAFINSKEANLLKSKGGAGKMTEAGIKSYAYSDSRDDPGGANQTSSSSSSSDDNSPQRQPASYRSVAPKTAAPQNILSKAGSGIVDYIKTGGTIGLVARTIGKVFSNIGGRVTQTRTSYNPMNEQPRNKPITGGNGGNDNTSASNVGGKIIKLAPTSAEVSQSKTTDVTYDSRKTKARGRSMTILTSAKGIGRNMGSVLGSKSLLGA